MHGRWCTAQLLPDLLASLHVIALLDTAGTLRVSLVQEVLKLAHTRRGQLSENIDSRSIGARTFSQRASSSSGEPAADEPPGLVASHNYLGASLVRSPQKRWIDVVCSGCGAVTVHSGRQTQSTTLSTTREGGYYITLKNLHRQTDVGPAVLVQ